MKAQNILQNHNLKRTPCREGIIDVILVQNNPMSELEIKEKLESNFDRTTFYRSFKTLLENNIIHKIVVDNQIVKYGLDKDISEKHNHAHFYCTECGMVKCMESIPVNPPKLPLGYIISETEVIIKGICNVCNS